MTESQVEEWEERQAEVVHYILLQMLHPLVALYTPVMFKISHSE